MNAQFLEAAVDEHHTGCETAMIPTCIATFRGNSMVMKWGCGPSELRPDEYKQTRLVRDVLPERVGIIIPQAFGAKSKLEGRYRPPSKVTNVWVWKWRRHAD